MEVGITTVDTFNRDDDEQDEDDEDGDLSILSQPTLRHFMDCHSPSTTVSHSFL